MQHFREVGRGSPSLARSGLLARVSLWLWKGGAVGAGASGISSFPSRPSGCWEL